MATLSVPPTEPRGQTLRPTAFGGIFGWGAVLLLLVGILAYVFIVWGGVDHFTDADATRVLERQKILQDRVTEDYKYLHDAPSYFKKDAGLVRVPIDEAMKMTLADLQKIKPHPAYPISQSPPQNAGAPTSPDKGAGQDIKTPGKTNDNNPTASNPTVGQPSPAPVAPSTTPAPATSASNAPASPAPAAKATEPAPTPATSPVPTAMPSATTAPTATVPPTPTPAPTNTPYTSAGPAATNNANNPGNPPIPGTQAQPSAPPMETNTSGVVTPTPAPSAADTKPEPLTNPAAAATSATPAPAAGSTPTPNPQEPGASPAGTP